MSACSCPRESEVLAALQSGSFSAPLRVHVAQCPTCAEVAFVAAALRDEAEVAEAEPLLPDPGLIWLAARSHSYRLRVERATRPIVVAQWVAGGSAAAVAVVTVTRLQPSFGAWLAHLAGTLVRPASGLMLLNGILLLAVSAGFLVAAGYAVITAWRET